MAGTGRPRIVAAQAVVVGVLMVVVFLTLLKPGDTGELFGIEVPGPPGAAQGPGGPQGPIGGDGDGRGENGPGNGRGASGGPGGGPGGPGGSTFPDDFVPDGLTTDSPTADQYRDAVARLTARLR
jgi:hypothetical protein